MASSERYLSTTKIHRRIISVADPPTIVLSSKGNLGGVLAHKLLAFARKACLCQRPYRKWGLSTLLEALQSVTSTRQLQQRRRVTIATARATMSRARTSGGRQLSWLTAFLCLTQLFHTTNSQIIGMDICYCAPSTYEFTLDFALTCPPVNITLGDAVAATSCIVSPFGDTDIVDLVPVAVQSIDIIELNQNLQITVQENIAGNFADGDTFRYTSIAADPENIPTAVDVPRAIQINIVGVNQFDQPIINVYLITFTGNCQAFPVLFEGQFAGWTRFVSTYFAHT